MTGKWLWLTILAVVVLTVGLVAGCGGGGGTSEDFIVGTWEVYALSDTYGGVKVPIENFGISYTATFYAGGTWVYIATLPSGIPPPSGTAEVLTGGGTWEKLGEDYLCHEPGEEDSVLLRNGNELYEVGVIEGLGLLWAWYHKV